MFTADDTRVGLLIRTSPPSRYCTSGYIREVSIFAHLARTNSRIKESLLWALPIIEIENSRTLHFVKSTKITNSRKSKRENYQIYSTGCARNLSRFNDAQLSHHICAWNHLLFLSNFCQGERTKFDRFVDPNIRGAKRLLYWQFYYEYNDNFIISMAKPWNINMKFHC